jgi:hypothetical protein
LFLGPRAARSITLSRQAFFAAISSLRERVPHMSKARQVIFDPSPREAAISFLGAPDGSLRLRPETSRQR